MSLGVLGRYSYTFNKKLTKESVGSVCVCVWVGGWGGGREYGLGLIIVSAAALHGLQRNTA